jgi:hypothetical protein
MVPRKAAAPIVVNIKALEFAMNVTAAVTGRFTMSPSY